MEPSSCAPHHVERRLPPLPWTIELFGRRFVNGYFIPAPGVATDHSSKMMRALVQEALAPVLPAIAVEIVAGHSHLHPARLFAEGLYRELHKGRTKMLFRELYNVKKDALREPHVFWEYLAQATLPTYVVLHYMLGKAKERRYMQDPAEQYRCLNERLLRFARLVGKRFPQAAYFVERRWEW